MPNIFQAFVITNCGVQFILGLNRDDNKIYCWDPVKADWTLYQMTKEDHEELIKAESQAYKLKQ